MMFALARLSLCAASIVTLVIAVLSDRWEPWPGTVIIWALWAVWEHGFYQNRRFDQEHRSARSGEGENG